MAANHHSAFKPPDQESRILSRPPSSPSPPCVEPLSPLRRPMEPTFNYPASHQYVWSRNDYCTESSSKSRSSSHNSAHFSPLWAGHAHTESAIAARNRRTSSSIADLADAALTPGGPRTLHRSSISHPLPSCNDRSDAHRRQSLQSYATNTSLSDLDRRPFKRMRPDIAYAKHTPCSSPDDGQARPRSAAHYTSSHDSAYFVRNHPGSTEPPHVSTEDALLLLDFASAASTTRTQTSRSHSPRSAPQFGHSADLTGRHPSAYYDHHSRQHISHSPGLVNVLNGIHQYCEKPVTQPVQMITPPAEQVLIPAPFASLDPSNLISKRPATPPRSRQPRSVSRKQKPNKASRSSTGAGGRKSRAATSRRTFSDVAVTPTEHFHQDIAKRRKSFPASARTANQPLAHGHTRAASLPPAFRYALPKALPGPERVRRNARTKPKDGTSATETVCAGCETARQSPNGGIDSWISCNGCDGWFHSDCAGFQDDRDTKNVDKFFCKPCEPKHGLTTFVRKSKRAHTSVDYAGLHQGVIKTSEDMYEHHYIEPIKNGGFPLDPEYFPRIRPELLTADYLARVSDFTDPIIVPAEWNQHPLKRPLNRDDEAPVTNSTLEYHDDEHKHAHPDLFEYETGFYDGQDKLDMVIPQDLTVRKVAELVGPDYPLAVIDVKVQNTHNAKWNLGNWADYYEAPGEKAIRNVISLEVSDTRLGKLLRRPKVVRDLDLQDHVWPADNFADRPGSVGFYCLMSVADSYTDFHIDFGGSSVYYHILRGRKTFFFIPPKEKHLKAYEAWNDDPRQNYTWLGNITKECYRVDLFPGDTMLIPSGWIHAVWTPENSLVIGGNFLNRLHLPMQLRVCEIERANQTPLKFRYPKFQRLMFFTALNYMETDPLPSTVKETLMAGKQFVRTVPSWQDFDLEASQPGHEAHQARYYAQMELDGLPELVAYLHRTVMITLDRVDGITIKRRKAVINGMPKMKADPLDIVKEFAIWVSWKRGNEAVPAWVVSDVEVHNDDPTKRSKVHNSEKSTAVPGRQSRRQKEQAAAYDAGAKELADAEIISQLQLGQPAVDRATHDTDTISPHTSDRLSVERKPSLAKSDGLVKSVKISNLGPKRTVCDNCRKRRIGCKHKSDDAVNESAESQSAAGAASSVSVRGCADVPQLPFNPDIPWKKKSRACEDCRRNKVRYTPVLLSRTDY